MRNLDKAKPQVEHDDESLPDDTDEDDEECPARREGRGRVALGHFPKAP